MNKRPKRRVELQRQKFGVSWFRKYGMVYQVIAMGQPISKWYGLPFIRPYLLSHRTGQALTTTFSQLLSQLIYSQEGLRPAILKALKTMVDSNVSLASEDNERRNLSRVEHISRTAAQENVSFLKTQADSWLAVLFNVFGTVDREDRGKIGDVIRVWASIAKTEVWFGC